MECLHGKEARPCVRKLVVLSHKKESEGLQGGSFFKCRLGFGDCDSDVYARSSVFWEVDCLVVLERIIVQFTIFKTVLVHNLVWVEFKEKGNEQNQFGGDFD